MFLLDWVDENDEGFILERYGVRPGELKAKLDHADWLLYACIELAKILQLRKAAAEAGKMRMRLEYGVKEELLPLLRLKGIGRVRGRKLFNAGIKDLGDVKDADLTKLSILIGRAVALDVKKQLGEEILPVSERTRKGQTGLGKYDE
jgi:helicase